MGPDSVLLTGRVALVTGAAGGIGRAIALTYAAVGADLVLLDLDEPELERATDKIREQGRRALALPADVHKQTDVDAFTAAAVRSFWHDRHPRQQRRRHTEAPVHGVERGGIAPVRRTG